MTRSKEPIARFEGYHFLDRSTASREFPCTARSPPRYAVPIETGEIPAGTRLPSTRSAGESLAVSRNTVLTAYEELAADGIVTGRTGSGTRAPGPSGRRADSGLPDPRSILRAGHYPLEMASFVDPDGNPLTAVRTGMTPVQPPALHRRRRFWLALGAGIALLGIGRGRLAMDAAPAADSCGHRCTDHRPDRGQRPGPLLRRPHAEIVDTLARSAGLSVNDSTGANARCWTPSCK